MLFKKQGLPEEGELVLCTVTNVQHHSVFARMDEYATAGMIHISEVSPGRIRNLRDYVKEGKVIVCKVLRVNQERGHVDLSLRRVSDNQRKIKVNEVKQEQKAEKIIEAVARAQKREVKDVFLQVSKPIYQHYNSLFASFMEVVHGEAELAALGVPPDLAKPLTETILQRLKPQEVVVKAQLRMSTYASDGVDKVVEIFKLIIKAGATVKYITAGNYRIGVKARDYKTANKLMESATKQPIEHFVKSGGTATLVGTE